MKKLLLLLLIFSTILSSNFGAISYSYSDNSYSYSNLKKNELISIYITSLKKEINIFKKKYNIEYDENLKKEIDELDKLIVVLANINNLEEKKADQVFLVVLDKLKKSKNNIKNILKEKKSNYEKNLKIKKDLYSKIGNKLNKKLNLIIGNIYKPLQNKSKLSQKETNIINTLKKLNKENNKLKNFGENSFTSEKQMKASFVLLLKNIKNEMLNLKKIGLN